MSKNSRKTILKFLKYWIIDSKKLLLHDLIIYIFLNTAVRKKLMKIHHDNSYTNYFKIEKIINFLWKKYYWQKFFKNIKNYVKTCNVCQYIIIIFMLFHCSSIECCLLIYIERKFLEWTNFLLFWFNNVFFFHLLWYHFEADQNSVSSRIDEKILKFQFIIFLF